MSEGTIRLETCDASVTALEAPYLDFVSNERF